MSKSNRPGSGSGTQILLTVRVGLRVLVMVQVLLWLAARVTEPLAAHAPPMTAL